MDWFRSVLVKRETAVAFHEAVAENYVRENILIPDSNESKEHVGTPFPGGIMFWFFLFFVGIMNSKVLSFFFLRRIAADADTQIYKKKDHLRIFLFF